MKLKALTAVVGMAVAQFALANGTAPAAPTAPAPIPQTSQQWLERMTDFTRNASAYRDPKVFVPWFNAVTEPSFYSQMGINMMEPGNWYKMFGSMMDPRSLANYMKFADPEMYMKWLAASMDPNFYTAMMAPMIDPGKYMRWAMSPLDPQTMNMGMQTLNPAMYMKWMMAPLDPRLMQLSMQPLNPAMYTGWMGAAMDPKTYGSWGTWLNPNTYVAPITGGMSGAPANYNFFNPAAPYAQPMPTIPGPAPAAGTPGYVNPFDPNVFLQMFNPAAFTAPMTAPAYHCSDDCTGTRSGSSCSGSSSGSSSGQVIPAKLDEKGTAMPSLFYFRQAATSGARLSRLARPPE